MRMFFAAVLVVMLAGGCGGKSFFSCGEREWPEDCTTLAEPDRDYCLEARSKTQPPEPEPGTPEQAPEVEAVPPAAEDATPSDPQ